MSSRVSQYAGLASNRNRRLKYEGCEHSKVRGLTVRLLTPAEIDEFRAHINAIISPSLRTAPKFRRSVV
jgi:hypothetical protein